jgi:uncharacterized protein YeeX (DUF496 family)
MFVTSYKYFLLNLRETTHYTRRNNIFNIIIHIIHSLIRHNFNKIFILNVIMHLINKNLTIHHIMSIRKTLHKFSFFI